MTFPAHIPVDAHITSDHRSLQIAASLGVDLGLPTEGAVSTIKLDRPSLAPVVEIHQADRHYLIANRRIPLQGATNFRDAGGRRGHGGALIDWRRHYRSENLGKLTPTDWETIEALGINLVLDLRHADESNMAPSKAPAGITILQIPIVGNLAGHVDATAALLEGRLAKIDDEDMRAMYLDLVAQHERDLLEAYELYRDHDQPIVVHCTAGKDRTGIVVALWQLSQGIALKDVLEDYRLSSLYRTLPRYLTLRSALRAANVDPRKIHSYISTQNASLQAALGDLDIAAIAQATRQR